MSRNAQRYSSRRSKKVEGLSDSKPKQTWENDRLDKSKKVTLTAKTYNQSLYMQSMANNLVTVATGSSGTGKTFLACYHAANELLGGHVQRIVITRPYAALANRTTGFKPSTDLEKLRGFILPLLGYLGEVLGKGMVEEHVGKADGKIELAPLESLRGRSFDNTIILVDEAQNCLPEEIEALCTRIGENSSIVFCGDPVQKDVREDKCGLLYLEQIIRRHNIPYSGIINFTQEDVVRSGICRDFVIAFDKERTQ